MENPQTNNHPQVRKSGSAKFIGIILIVVGGSYLVRHFIPWIPFGLALALLAIIFGVVLIARR